ncbi:hypothetical protein [Furfurilactobacillus curtus]|uniref:Uncharacterized protein n=1 Tax=Furfurilactobacillus curtus TaxID=1746200 RepID=A0ABQ5JKP3_9LACO
MDLEEVNHYVTQAQIETTEHFITLLDNRIEPLRKQPLATRSLDEHKAGQMLMATNIYDDINNYLKDLKEAAND